MRTPFVLASLGALLGACTEPRTAIGSWHLTLNAAELTRSVCIDLPSDPDRAELRRAVLVRVTDALPGSAPRVEWAGQELVVQVAGSWTAVDKERLRTNLEDTWGPSLALEVDEDGFVARGTTLVGERDRVLSYMAASEAASLEAFNVLPPPAGGLAAGVVWLRKIWTASDGGLADHDLLPVVRPPSPYGFWAFDRAGLTAETGADGRPALRVSLAAVEAERLARFSAEHQDQVLVITCGEHAIAAPRIAARLRTSFLLSGMFTQAEVDRIVELAGGAPARPWTRRTSR